MALRIRPYKGKNFISYNLAIIKNFRDKSRPSPNNTDHDVLAYLGTFRDDNPLYKLKVIESVDRAADRLVLRKKLSEREAKRVKEKARKTFPLPPAPAAPAPQMASAVSDEVRQRVKEKYGALLKTEH